MMHEADEAVETWPVAARASNQLHVHTYTTRQRRRSLKMFYKMFFLTVLLLQVSIRASECRRLILHLGKS